ncbi:MAG TPA: D-aminoacylase [Pyrinomonadaceae bacterium]|nr:D-aminoacylase [Pyrinomonadaceae bacterium]
MTKPIFATILLILLAAILTFGQNSIVIKNATIIDGSGKTAFRGDVQIKGDKITKIGNIKPKKDDVVIDAGGKILAPGFIDIHNHSESGLLKEGTATNQISQGITTILVGPDGGSPFPIADYLNKLQGKISPNVGAFIGHATLREEVMNNSYARQTTPEELGKMVVLMEQAMKEGAFGLSSGLEYDTGYSASTEELIALAKVAAKYHGIYMTHMRDEEEGMLDAVRESIRISKEAKLPLQISHIKMGNRNVWGKSVDAIALVEMEKKNGVDITADAYPYTAWGSTITVLVPSRKHEDRKEVETGLFNVGGGDKVLVTSCSAHRDYEGKNLDEIAKMKGVSPVDVYIQIVKDGGASVVCNSMNENDVKNFYQQSWVMVSSDGGIGGRHPRGTGTFPRVLGRFVRENKWLSLEEAVHKMSLMPAKRLGLKDRGIIKKGMKADLVLFDKDKVIDRNTFLVPQTLSEGIETVWVNGKAVWDSGKVTGAMAGEILRRK